LPPQLSNRRPTIDNSEQGSPIPQPGQAVQVVDGPFTGFHGVVESVNEEERKAIVAVAFFGRAILASFFFYQIEPLSDSHPRPF
jgi:transcriptional antiterminator NusG